MNAIAGACQENGSVPHNQRGGKRRLQFVAENNLIGVKGAFQCITAVREKGSAQRTE